MLGEATLDGLGTFFGEAIRLLILFAAQQNRRIGGGRVVQRPLLYLGEINE
jgi:hypothetical protein